MMDERKTVDQQAEFFEDAIEVCKLLDEINCCYGCSIPLSDYLKFWDAQEKARSLLARMSPAPDAASPQPTRESDDDEQRD